MLVHGTLHVLSVSHCNTCMHDAASSHHGINTSAIHPVLPSLWKSPFIAHTQHSPIPPAPCWSPSIRVHLLARYTSNTSHNTPVMNQHSHHITPAPHSSRAQGTLPSARPPFGTDTSVSYGNLRNRWFLLLRWKKNVLMKKAMHLLYCSPGQVPCVLWCFTLCSVQCFTEAAFGLPVRVARLKSI